MTILDRIIADKRVDVAERQAARPLEALRDALRDGQHAPRDFAAALKRTDGVAAIAEIKRRSPSQGPLRAALDPAQMAQEYQHAGAAALSILTEGKYFGGSDQDLVAARGAADLPVLRKDFTVDPYQIYEARAIGADAILLIARVLTQDELSRLSATAREVGLVALVEVHDVRELERALTSDAGIIGVNNRNLDTFEVSLETCLRLRERIPPDRIAVAESGIRTRADVERLEAAGFDAMLVGEALLTAPSPGARLAELLGRGAAISSAAEGRS